MSKKLKMSKKFSINFLLNNLKEKNIESEVCRTFKFIISKDKVRVFLKKMKEKGKINVNMYNV